MKRPRQHLRLFLFSFLVLGGLCGFPGNDAFPKIAFHRDGRMVMPDSLAPRLGSGRLEMILNEHLRRTAGHPELEAVDRILVNLYFAEYPDGAQVDELEALGVRLYPETWTPPMEAHPLGFVLAEIPPLKFLDVITNEIVRRIDTAENLAEPMNNNAM